jgi:hypothetical protein
MTIESNKNKLPKARLTKLTIGELSLVDRPCQEPATVALMKRAPEAAPVAKRGLLTSAEQGHSHLLDDQDGAGSGYTSCECMGEGNEATYHSHPWSRDDAGNIVIGMSAGHTHVPLDPANTDEAAMESAKRAAELALKSTRHAATGNVNSTSQEHTQMKTDAEKLADLQKRHDRTERIVKLSPAHFGHFVTLTGDAQDEFLAKSATDRDAVIAGVEKRNDEANKVVYVSKSDGAVYRAKDDARMIDMAKRLDAQAEDIEKADVRKAAAELLPSAPGADADHDYIVRSLRKGGGDAAQIERATAVIKGLVATSRLGKGAAGSSGNADPTNGSQPDALAALEKGLVTFCKAQNITKHLWTEGLDAFKQTPEGEALKRAYDESTAS